MNLLIHVILPVYLNKHLDASGKNLKHFKF